MGRLAVYAIQTAFVAPFMTTMTQTLGWDQTEQQYLVVCGSAITLASKVTYGEKVLIEWLGVACSLGSRFRHAH